MNAAPPSSISTPRRLVDQLLVSVAEVRGALQALWDLLRGGLQSFKPVVVENAVADEGLRLRTTIQVHGDIITRVERTGSAGLSAEDEEMAERHRVQVMTEAAASRSRLTTLLSSPGLVTKAVWGIWAALELAYNRVLETWAAVRELGVWLGEQTLETLPWAELWIRVEPVAYEVAAGWLRPILTGWLVSILTSWLKEWLVMKLTNWINEELGLGDALEA